jgi:hypothetical protein
MSSASVALRRAQWLPLLRESVRARKSQDGLGPAPEGPDAVGGGKKKGEVQCSERERLEFALMEMLDRLDYLQELYRRNQSLDWLEQEIKRLGLKVQQMQLRLRVHLRVHECL